MNPSITITIPTFNRSQRVYALVQAVLPQLGDGDEIIVSDDASGDDTAQRLTGIDKVTVHRHASRLGMVANWNYCLTAGSNAWVCMIHDDDRLTPHGLAAIRRVIAETKGPALIAHSEWDRRDQDVASGLHFEVREPGTIASLRSELCPSGLTTHKQVIETVGGYNDEYRYSADLEFLPRICARFPSYIIHNPRVLEYIFHDGNYQLKTWREPDFLEQLERVHSAAVGHAGIDPDTARKVVGSRMTRDMLYMLRTAKSVKDTQRVKAVAKALRNRARGGIRQGLALKMSRVLGWYPDRLLS